MEGQHLSQSDLTILPQVAAVIVWIMGSNQEPMVYMGLSIKVFLSLFLCFYLQGTNIWIFYIICMFSPFSFFYIQMFVYFLLVSSVAKLQFPC